MRTLQSYIIFISLLFIAGSCYRAEKPVPVCRVENNKVIFRLDNRWNKQQLQEIALLYDLDTAIFTKAFDNQKEFVINNATWRIKKINSHNIDLSKPVENMTDSLISNGYVYMLKGGIFGGLKPQTTLSDKYGINLMLRDNTFKYSNGTAFFWLPGHKDSKSVYLSGTFNNWSTSSALMAPCDSGWTISIKLKPGKYAYKYIIDGNWTPDPVNSLKEDDLNGDFNSVIYCYNYLFKVNGRRDANDVRVTGDFMNWNLIGLNMKRTQNGWELPLYLREGTYAYKFVSGQSWFTDPENPDVRDDGSGNMNSYISIGDKHTFNLEGYTQASTVILTGTFNDWNEDELKMKKSGTGWTISCAFPPGNYEYKFIVDGTWMPDPLNENTTGTEPFINSIISLHPNHTFILLNHPDAKEVMVTGSFNSFNNPGYRMSKKEGGWMLPLYLNPGKTIYKFIVDGQWILDPANELWEDNEFGTGNSVVWIEQ